MTLVIDIEEAEGQLSSLVSAVEAGEEVVIARAGKRVARIIAEQAARRGPVRFGMLAGEYPEIEERLADGLPDFELIDWQRPDGTEELERHLRQSDQ